MMYKFFELADVPRIASARSLYQKDGYFNYIPYKKIKKYTDIERITTEKGSVFVESKTVHEVNCSLIICTFNNPENVRKNVFYLHEKIKAQTDFKCEIIIVDNGRSLLRSDFENKAILVPNVNTGGSGGYKRGMEEALKIGGFTHFILMDDDVEIEFCALQKCLNFLKFTKLEYEDICISGSMLYMDKPTRQFEAGGRFEKDGTQRGFGHFLDLAIIENLEINERENLINYGGWWFMCMPFKFIEQGNFPKPFFLKYDDVEYAMRCGLKIITLNGVGVWHDPHEWKYNSSTEYYNTRNYLFLCSEYCDNFNAEFARKFVEKKVSDKLIKQQYQMAEAILRGYEDYKKGWDFLENIGAEGNHIEICKLNYKFIPYEEVTKEYGVKLIKNKFIAPLSKRTRLKSIISKKYAITDHFYDLPYQYCGKKIAVHCNSVENTGYVTEYDEENENQIKNKLRSISE